jgi:16S rRNA (cytidine1402-2'-O)-methyltransferase
MEKSEEPRVVVGRELTKIYEEIKKGKVSEILEYYKKYPDKVKGEFVVIII